MLLDLKIKYEKDVVPKLLEMHGYSNVMSIPKLEKVVINRGLGELVSNPKSLNEVIDQMLALTGQRPVLCKAKKSISNFKIREGQVIGCKVTLRGKRMYDFLVKLLCIALPKIRDFRGVPRRSFDGRGNYSLGLSEDTIFPEIYLKDSAKVRGFDVAIVTTALTDKEAFDLLDLMGMPFRRS